MHTDPPVWVMAVVMTVPPVVLVAGVVLVVRMLLQHARFRAQLAGVPASAALSPLAAPVAVGVMRFRNPANGYIEVVSKPGLWTFLFGGFYFAAKGIWQHAIVALLLALVTGGLSWLCYPFFARSLLRTHYLQLGWQQV
jgi:hypothetical protein